MPGRSLDGLSNGLTHGVVHNAGSQRTSTESKPSWRRNARPGQQAGTGRRRLDIHLPDRTGDEDYPSALAAGPAEALQRAAPDLAIYLAGADPYEGDRLGRLALTKTGLARRDRMVLKTLRDAHVPTDISMAGGYAKELDDVVDIHFTTVSIAAELAP